MCNYVGGMIVAINNTGVTNTPQPMFQIVWIKAHISFFSWNRFTLFYI